MDKREGECVKCGQCCRNPSVSVVLPEDQARFYSYFGIEVSKIEDKFKGRFSVGTVCRHFTPDHVCNIYENRPDICKNYPLKGNILHGTCGYK